jgi:hypothetical protein
VVVFFTAGFVWGVVVNHRLFRLFHATALFGVTLLMTLGLPCPLTVWEETFTGTSHGGSFIAYWLDRILYLRWFTPDVVFLLDLGFACLVASSFLWRPVRAARALP